MRGHHDQIAPSRQGGVDDSLVDLFVLDMKRLTDDTGQLCRIRNDTEHFFGMSLSVLLVFDRGVFELARRDREQMEWLGDRHGGNLGTDLLGEEDALFDSLGGEVRSIGRDQDVLEQYSSPPVAASFTRRLPKIALRSTIEATIPHHPPGIPVIAISSSTRLGSRRVRGASLTAG